jgi:hypothetical protein
LSFDASKHNEVQLIRLTFKFHNLAVGVARAFVSNHAILSVLYLDKPGKWETNLDEDWVWQISSSIRCFAIVVFSLYAAQMYELVAVELKVVHDDAGRKN